MSRFRFGQQSSLHRRFHSSLYQRSIVSMIDDLNLHLLTGLPNPVGIWVSFRVSFIFIFYFIFSVSGKFLPVTPLLSGVFVHRVFCAYFVRFEGGWGNG